MSSDGFHGFFYGLSVGERKLYAQRVGTTVGYLEKVAFGDAAPSLGMLYRIHKADSRVTLEAVYATWHGRQLKRAMA